MKFTTFLSFFSYVSTNINTFSFFYIKTSVFFNDFVSPVEVQNLHFLTPSKSDPFSFISSIQFWHFLVKSGPTQYWHHFFSCLRLRNDEKRNAFLMIYKKHTSFFHEIIKNRQGFSLLLKFNVFINFEKYWKSTVIIMKINSCWSC